MTLRCSPCLDMRALRSRRHVSSLGVGSPRLLGSVLEPLLTLHAADALHRSGRAPGGGERWGRNARRGAVQCAARACSTRALR